MVNIQNSENYDKLKDVLKEVFQLDQADLDFGIYRIMNQKRNEITDFLDKRLLPEVTEILLKNGDGSNTKAQQELDKAIEQANSLGVDPETLPKVKELRARLSSTTSVDTLEQEVYSHLANFFKRYYKDGDFISLRRYKKDVYAIPYEGEEVKLHWANHDQYYIKTSEYLKNYGFKLPNGKAVKFELKEASTEQNNNKEQSGKERKFEIYHEFPLEVSEDETTLIINFTYEEHDKKVKQDQLNKDALAELVPKIPQDFYEVLEKIPTEKNKNRTLLEKHIKDFTSRNSFDYFIHKDLEGFLSRELDFYIKNEVLYLDDINTDNEQDFIAQLSKVKAIKQVAQKIITFLAQLENFQKKLWLKKKFVIATNYCITIDRIPEEYYEEICKNKVQLNEWKELFKINELKGDLLSIPYSEPLTIEFLKSQPFLVLDTKFFKDDFKDSLLAEFDDIDEQTNGLLINSENFQAINLLKAKFENNIKCAFYDPPYNTGGSEFIYKNNFQHSSWLSMMYDRIKESKVLLRKDGIQITCIDDFELNNLQNLLNGIYTEENMLGNLVIEIKPSGRTNDYFFATSHEYYLFHGKDKNNCKINFFDLSEDQKKQYKESDSISSFKWRDFLRTGGYSTPKERPNSYYPIYFNPTTSEIKLEESKGFVEVLPIDSTGTKRVWRKTRPSFMEHVLANEIKISQRTDGSYKVQIIDRIKDGIRPKALWTGSKYDASSHGSKLLNSMFKNSPFSYPKSLYAVIDSINVSIPKNENNAIVIDSFAGSGTTGQAVIELNKNIYQRNPLKYIMVEMGEYFNTVTKPRIIKSVYSSNWKNGFPYLIDGVSQFIKYNNIETYEDVLNNLSLENNKLQSSLLENSDFKDEYILSYMLDVESRESLLNIDAFKNPFNYKLNITHNNDCKETIVDLVETFNYLIGLHVKTMQTIRGFKVITGITNEQNEETLVIWRNTEEKSNQDLNDFFTKMDFSTRDTEFQRIYVNGDNHLENLKTGDDNWKVVLIEEEFIKRMFDVQDV